MGMLLALILLVALFAGVYVLLNGDLPAILVMVVVLVLAFVLGGLLATLLNWSDAPAVVAIAVAGGFLWRELRQICVALQGENRYNVDDPTEGTPDSDASGKSE